LYVVSTPIGNLADLSRRAAEILREADVIYAEDTRHTRGLVRGLGVRAPLLSLHEHNERARTEEVMDRLRAGEACALVCDAGTPCVSDPGFRVTREAARHGFSVVPIPGASAILAALAASGLPTDRFAFLGFPPRSGTRRRTWMREIVGLGMTAVVFESPRRVGDLLAEWEAEGLGDRGVALCRELTKLHEEIRRGTVSELSAYYRQVPPRGEITVVLAGGSRPEEGGAPPESVEKAVRKAEEMVRDGRTTREVVQHLRAECGLSRNEAYELALGLGSEEGAG